MRCDVPAAEIVLMGFAREQDGSTTGCDLLVVADGAGLFVAIWVSASLFIRLLMQSGMSFLAPIAG